MLPWGVCACPRPRLLLILIGPHRRRFRPAVDPHSTMFPPVPSDHQRQPGGRPACSREISDCQMEEGARERGGWGDELTTGFAKSLAGLAWAVHIDIFLAWWLSKHPRTHSHTCTLPTSCIHSLPSPNRAHGSQAAFLFKVKLLLHAACVEFLRRRLHGTRGLLVLLLVFIAAQTLEKCHGEEGVEEHDDHDVHGRVGVALPGARGCGVGCWARRAVDVPSADVKTGVLQNLLASGEERQQQGPIHVFHTRIKDGRWRQRGQKPNKPNTRDSVREQRWKVCEAGARRFRKGTLWVTHPLSRKLDKVVFQR